jgi:hypothetical protein
MPNWKKVIVSGSNAFLNHITASGNISASGKLYGGLTNQYYPNLVYYNTSSGELTYLDRISVTTPITASGGITSSGTIQALHITSSGNIKAIGTITATTAEIDGTVTATSFVGNFKGTLTKEGLSNTLTLPTTTDTLVGRATADTLTNKTLTTPIISSISNTGTLTLPTSTDTLVGRATADTLTNKTLTTPIISSISNTGTLTLPTSTDTLVGRATADTLTNKTLNTPIIEEYAAFNGSTSGTTKLVATEVAESTVLTLPAATDTLVGKATTDTLTNKTLTAPRISSIVNTGTLTLPTSTDTLVGRATTDTLTFKTLYRPGIQNYAAFEGGTSGTTFLQATAVAGTTTLTLPAATDTLVGRATTDTLTNKTLTAPTITGAGAIAGVFTGNITGNVTGNADTVTTNANLTGPVTSTGNTTAIADGAITTAMQKHLQTFEFNGYIASAASTNYFIPALISTNTGPFNHSTNVGAAGTTAIAPSSLLRTGGQVMPYDGTCKLWKGWVGVSGLAAFKVSIFKYTPTANNATNASLVLVKEFSGTAAGNSNLKAIDLTTDFTAFSAGDILITGISCAVGAAVYFTSNLEVEWD